MCLSSPDIGSPTAAPAAPTSQDPAVQAALDADRKRRQGAMGASSTILTGQLGGIAPPTTAPKTFLGA